MNEWQSLIFYLASFSLSALLIYIGGLQRFVNVCITLPRRVKVNVFTLLGLLIPIFIGGFLYNVGIDYEGYIRLFEKSNELNYAGFVAFNDFWTVEPTFYVIARLSMALTGSSWLMFLIYAAANIIFFYLFLRRATPKYKALAFFMYLMVFYLFTMTLMRQGAAISLCLYALTFLFDQKNVKFLFTVGVASLIHFSALFFVIPWILSILIRPRKGNWLLMATLFVVGLLIIASPLIIQFITSFPPFDKYAYLLDKERENVLIGWTFLMQLGIVGIISVFYYRMPRTYSRASLLYAMLLTGIIAYSLNFRVNYASRLSFFFLPVSTVLMTYVIDMFRYNRILITAVVIGCVVYFIKIYYTGNTMMVFPYNFIWSS